jgi:hypothetical protein
VTGLASPDTSAISEPIKALLGLFETDFSDVKFPDIDTEVLAAAARNVLAAADQVAEAEAALEAARTELQETQEALLQKGQRALAYARVFAEDSEELTQKLQLISLPRGQRRTKLDAPTAGAEVMPVRRRGRPPKAKVEGPNLFQDEAAEELAQVG